MSRITASDTLPEKGTSVYLRETYVRQLEDLAKAKRQNLHYWCLKTFLSQLNPVAGVVVASLEGYKEIKDQLSDWKLALTTLVTIYESFFG